MKFRLYIIRLGVLIIFASLGLQADGFEPHSGSNSDYDNPIMLGFSLRTETTFLEGNYNTPVTPYQVVSEAQFQTWNTGLQLGFVAEYHPQRVDRDEYSFRCLLETGVLFIENVYSITDKEYQNEMMDGVDLLTGRLRYDNDMKFLNLTLTPSFQWYPINSLAINMGFSVEYIYYLESEERLKVEDSNPRVHFRKELEVYKWHNCKSIVLRKDKLSGIDRLRYGLVCGFSYILGDNWKGRLLATADFDYNISGKENIKYKPYSLKFGFKFLFK
jgi:hypothetical protein